ncbi:MAG: tRNA lysidine(34) synthetase TilS, partial [Limnochordia bacterium]
INPRFVEAMLNLADTARGENEWMESKACELLNDAVPTDGGWWMPRGLVEDQPLGLRRRALRALLRRFDTGSEPDFDHIESIEEMLTRGQTGARASLPHSIVVWMEKEGFWVGPEAPVVEFENVVPVPGRVRLPSSDLCLVAHVRAGGLDSVSELSHCSTQSERPWHPERRNVVLDWEQVAGRMRVRNWHPGDRYRPLGMHGEKKLQDMFVDEGVPQRWRRRLPVVVDDQGILWVPGARPADRVKVTSATRTLVALSVCKGDA